MLLFLNLYFTSRKGPEFGLGMNGEMTLTVKPAIPLCSCSRCTCSWLVGLGNDCLVQQNVTSIHVTGCGQLSGHYHLT